MPTFARRIANRVHAPCGYKTVLTVGLPLIAGMASTTVMQFTDRLFLSRYSLEAISAAMPAGTMAIVLQLTLAGICGYVSVFIAQYTGAARPREVGPVLWQGIWMSLVGALLLGAACFLAEPLFHWGGHAPVIRAQEVVYFQTLNAGAGFFLLSTVLGGFFVGRGVTRPVLLANFAGAALNIPLDYVLIFGAGPVPAMGIFGAAVATILGSVLTCIVFAVGIFRPKNEARFRVFSAWPLRWDIVKSLLRFGGPSGVNLFMEVVGFAWFMLEVGKLGLIAQAASNIALSINNIIFVPMLGLNAAVATLVGQAMGRKNPDDAMELTISSLHLARLYIIPLSIICVLAGGPLMDLFRPAQETVQGAEDFAAVRAIGAVLLCYIAVYSLLDSYNIVCIGALKGAGDTVFIMLILGGTALFFLILPVLILKHLGLESVHTLWTALTSYVMLMAVCVRARFKSNKWRAITMIEN